MEVVYQGCWSKKVKVRGKIFPLVPMATWAPMTVARVTWLAGKLKLVSGERVIRKLATMTKLKRLLNGAGAQPVEAFWAWVAELSDGAGTDGEVLGGQGGAEVERFNSGEGETGGMVRKVVLVALGCNLEVRPSSRLVLWMSPPCRTFFSPNICIEQEQEGLGSRVGKSTGWGHH